MRLSAIYPVPSRYKLAQQLPFSPLPVNYFAIIPRPIRCCITYVLEKALLNRSNVEIYTIMPLAEFEELRIELYEQWTFHTATCHFSTCIVIQLFYSALPRAVVILRRMIRGCMTVDLRGTKRPLPILTCGVVSCLGGGGGSGKS